MNRPLVFAAAAAAPLALFASSPGAAQDTPRDLSDLIGARGSSGETQLEARGYRHIRTETGDDRKYSYWWNDRLRACVSVSTYDGRYNAIVATLPADCGMRDSRPERPYPPPGNPPQRPPYPDDDYGRPGPGGGTLTLICWGAGDKPSVRSGTDYVWNSRRHRYEPRTYTQSGREGFSSAVQVELWGDGGRIHLTGKLVPPINSGGRDGWWDLYEVRMGPDRITARYRLNGLNKPRVDIDRRSGMISIDGIEDFQGRCDQGNWGGRRF